MKRGFCDSRFVNGEVWNYSHDGFELPLRLTQPGPPSRYELPFGNASDFPIIGTWLLSERFYPKQFEFIAWAKVLGVPFQPFDIKPVARVLSSLLGWEMFVSNNRKTKIGPAGYCQIEFRTKLLVPENRTNLSLRIDWNPNPMLPMQQIGAVIVAVSNSGIGARNSHVIV